MRCLRSVVGDSCPLRFQIRRAQDTSFLGELTWFTPDRRQTHTRGRSRIDHRFLDCLGTCDSTANAAQAESDVALFNVGGGGDDVVADADAVAGR